MVALLAFSCIPKPQLCHRKVRLLSEQTAVLTPRLIIYVAVAFTARICTWIWNGYPARALSVISWFCSTPILHFGSVTCHPPAKSAVFKEARTIAPVLDKLLAVSRCIKKASQVLNINKALRLVMHISYVASARIVAIDPCFVLAVVTDDCHANCHFVSHVTKHRKRSVTTWSIRIDDVRTTSGLWTASFDLSASLCWKYKHIKILYFRVPKWAQIAWNKNRAFYAGNLICQLRSFLGCLYRQRKRKIKKKNERKKTSDFLTSPVG